MRRPRNALARAALAAALLAAAACAKKPAPSRLLEYEVLDFRDASTPQAKAFEADVFISPWADTSDVKRTVTRIFTDLSQGELKVRPGYGASSYKRADAAPGAVEIIRARIFDAKPAEPGNKLCLAQWVNDVEGLEVPADQRDTTVPFLNNTIYIDWNPDKLAARLQ